MVVTKNMDKIKENLQKRYEINRLEEEIYLWQIHIIENPNYKECYENAIKSNLDKLKKLR